MSATVQLLAARPRAIRGTYFVQTWGCQMNEEDSEQMAAYLEQIGFAKAASMMEAQVILLNTCSVRKKPEDKAFSMLGELIPLKRNRPDVILGVCGCMAQLRADEIRKRAPHVDFVVGTGQVAQIPALVEEALQQRRFQKRVELPERKGSVVEEMPRRQVRNEGKLKAYVPIQYGCDKFCTFCIVPMTRGRERSRPTTEIVDEVAQLVAQGTKEVTLLGQTVNSYGKNMPEGKVSFANLLWQLDKIDGLERVRYTSPYPRDFKTDLIATIRNCPSVMEHCHMPIQGGKDSLLRRMKRLYTVDSYMAIVEELRQAMPGIGLTTDIIVGFPGESEEEFEGTLEVVRKVRYDGAYMFAYSPRPGTPAGDMEQLPQELKTERLARLMALQNEITLDINQSLIGQTFEVLVEGVSPRNANVLQGYSREWRMMHFPGEGTLRGQLVKVKAEGAHHWGLSGTIATP